jgi:hypothetical protein
MKKLSIATLLAILCFSACTEKEENPLQSLRSERIHDLSFFLYPSTIRMLNIANDTSFFELTKNIKRAHYLQVALDTPKAKEIYATWKEDVFETYAYENIMTARFQGGLVNAYAPADSDEEYLIMFDTGSSVNLVWVKGALNLAKLPSIMQKGIDLGLVNDYINDRNRKQERAEKMKKLRKGATEENNSTINAQSEKIQK